MHTGAAHMFAQYFVVTGLKLDIVECKNRFSIHTAQNNVVRATTAMDDEHSITLVIDDEDHTLANGLCYFLNKV